MFACASPCPGSARTSGLWDVYRPARAVRGRPRPPSERTGRSPGATSNGAERELKGTSYPEGARGYTRAIMGPVASVERVPASLLPRWPSALFRVVLRVLIRLSLGMRCFVAVWPRSDVVAALAGLPRPVIEGLRWSGRDQWHVTLRFFGELSTSEAGLAVEAIMGVAQGLAGPVTAQGGPATRFLGPGLVIWPVEGLRPAAEAVETATADIGQPVPDRRFFGHLTIARGRRGVDLRRYRDVLVPLAASWPVTALSLVQSELHPDGARYRELEGFVIGPGPGAKFGA
jgi:RNA 2',3'-cyclic 3'-phosphodiesterase